MKWNTAGIVVIVVLIVAGIGVGAFAAVHTFTRHGSPPAQQQQAPPQQQSPPPNNVQKQPQSPDNNSGCYRVTYRVPTPERGFEYQYATICPQGGG